MWFIGNNNIYNIFGKKLKTDFFQSQKTNSWTLTIVVFLLYWVFLYIFMFHCLFPLKRLQTYSTFSHFHNWHSSKRKSFLFALLKIFYSQAKQTLSNTFFISTVLSPGRKRPLGLNDPWGAKGSNAHSWKICCCFFYQQLKNKTIMNNTEVWGI